MSERVTFLAVVGESYRQDALARLLAAHPDRACLIALVPEPENPADPPHPELDGDRADGDRVEDAPTERWTPRDPSPSVPPALKRRSDRLLERTMREWSREAAKVAGISVGIVTCADQD